MKLLIEWLISAGELLLSGILMILDVLPDMPESVQTVVDGIFDIMFQGINLVGLFIDFDMVKILFPIVILIVNFDKIYKLIMWILRKIPTLSIK